MKVTTSIGFSILLVVGAALSAQGDAARTDINPALLYYQAFEVRPNLEPADNTYLLNNDWRGQKLTERFGELVAKYDAQSALIRQAARCTVSCDWGIDMSAGPATLLPHLARAKAVAQTARLRALWALQQGRPADACDDLLAARRPEKTPRQLRSIRSRLDPLSMWRTEPVGSHWRRGRSGRSADIPVRCNWHKTSPPLAERHRDCNRMPPGRLNRPLLSCFQRAVQRLKCSPIND
jgi:hypothetical protein